jgi:hypothetical protein
VIYLAGAIAVLVFMTALEGFGVVRVAAAAVKTSRGSFGVLRDPDLTDREKERALQAASLSLGKGFFSIGIRSAGAVAASLISIILMDLIGLVEMASVLDWLATWPGIAGMSLLVTGWYVARRFL